MSTDGEEKYAGIKTIYHPPSKVDLPDDPEYPFKLSMNFRPPEFMAFTFMLLHGGSEELVIQGKTAEALQAVIDGEEYESHPRLRRYTITGPDGTTIKQFPQLPPAA